LIKEREALAAERAALGQETESTRAALAAQRAALEKQRRVGSLSARAAYGAVRS
jgi:hypothetical protein